MWRTVTGGYSSNKNSRAENRIKKLTYKVRAMLMEATGGSEGYTDLRGPAMLHAQNLVNELPERGWKSPNEKSGHGKAINTDELHVFGAIARVHIPKQKRQKVSSQVPPYIKVGDMGGEIRENPRGTQGDAYMVEHQKEALDI